MDLVAIAVGVGWIFAGLLCLGLSIPLMRGQVGRNPVYGVRFPASFESDDAWFAINRYGGKRMAIWSVPMILVGVAALFLPLQSNVGLALLLGFAPLVFILIPILATWRFAQRR